MHISIINHLINRKFNLKLTILFFCFDHSKAKTTARKRKQLE